MAQILGQSKLYAVSFASIQIGKEYKESSRMAQIGHCKVSMRQIEHKPSGTTKEQQLISKDIFHGYALPQYFCQNSSVTQDQNIIDEFKCDNSIGKNRLTHDQSYEWWSVTSVNSRVDKDKVPPCMFGACIKRLINWAVAARRKYPNRRILASKIGYKYHPNMYSVARIGNSNDCSTSHLWGRSSSETVCDLAIAIVQYEDWNLVLNWYLPSYSHANLSPLPKEEDYQ